MPECDGYFDFAEILFEPEYQDIAVRYVWTDPDIGFTEKKTIIQCWFDVTYGEWNGSRYDLKDSRTQMANFIRKTKYATFEELLEDPYAYTSERRPIGQLPKM